MWHPVNIKLTKEDIVKATEKSILQTKKYGHDSGYFKLGRSDSSHEIGFIGELSVLRYFKNKYKIEETPSIGLCEMGAQFDVYIIFNKIKHYIHVKTGKWQQWPNGDRAFGVHFGQRIEKSGAPVVLVSYLANDPSNIRIEGFLTPEEIAKCPIIKKGELFPESFYPSRCDNVLTYFKQYEDIENLIDYFKKIN